MKKNKNVFPLQVYLQTKRENGKFCKVAPVVAHGSQGSGEEEDLDEDDSLSEDSGSELQDDLQDDSEQSFGKSQPATPSPSPPATPRPTRRHRKARSPSISDDENCPPSPKVRKAAVTFKMTLQQQILRTCFWLY